MTIRQTGLDKDRRLLRVLAFHVGMGTLSQTNDSKDADFLDGIEVREGRATFDVEVELLFEVASEVHACDEAHCR